MQACSFSRQQIVAAMAVGAAVFGGAAASAANAASQSVSGSASVQLANQEAQLQSSLSGIPGIDASQVQALISDLNSLASGGTAPMLGSDLDAVLTALGNSAGDQAAVQSLTATLGGLLDGTPGAGAVAQTISELEGLAADSGVPAPVSDVASELAGGLTSADLAALLGQPGSPLDSSAVQGVLGDVADLGTSPVGGSVPTGDLSSIGQAIDTIADEPGVPAPLASTLDGVASELASGSAVTPATLGSAAGTLEGAASLLDGTPAGAAPSSVLSALSTELAASPPASGSSTSTSVQGQFVTQATATQVTGATIKSFKYSRGKAVLTVTCPSGFSGGCHSKIYVQITHGRLLHTKVTIKAGKSKTVRMVLPKTATVARAHARTLVLDAAVVTNNYATSKTIRVHVK
jgi:hypothetical protein